jgi:hypothetical protein
MRQRERELQATWTSGRYRGATLTTRGGERLRVLYEGRRGGPAGPDFRDAVLEMAGGGRVCGDVEIHLSARGWTAHGHAGDPRYRGVVVHLVVTGGAEESSPLVDGRRTPTALLGEVACGVASAAPWPCEELAQRRGTATVRALVRALGWERFAERARTYEGELAGVASAGRAGSAEDAENGEGWGGSWSAEDGALWAAVAESLGYGRDREGLRAAGLRLLGGWAPLAVLEASGFAGVERKRLLGLMELWRRWRVRGPWAEVERRLRADTMDAARRGLVEALAVEGG